MKLSIRIFGDLATSLGHNHVMELEEGSTLATLTKRIAEKHRAKACCSLTTGIFVMTAANATQEAAKEGKSLRVPYWRTLKPGGFLNEKYPGGAEAHRELLEKEGFKVVGKGRRFVVSDYQKYLADV
jgi:hypothetical protein